MTNRFLFVTALFLVGVFVVSYAHDAYACSCASFTDKEALDESFASFVGVPTMIEPARGHTNLITFEIEKPIKNIEKNTTEIVLTTPSQGPTCGYHFENNTRYLVHTHEMKNQKYLQTSLCSGNKELVFSNMPLIIDEFVLVVYPAAITWYPVMLYLIMAGIISGSVLVWLVWRKRR